MGHNEIGDGFINVIGYPYGNRMLDGFVGLRQVEARLIKIKNRKE